MEGDLGTGRVVTLALGIPETSDSLKWRLKLILAFPDFFTPAVVEWIERLLENLPVKLSAELFDSVSIRYLEKDLFGPLKSKNLYIDEFDLTALHLLSVSEYLDDADLVAMYEVHRGLFDVGRGDFAPFVSKDNARLKSAKEFKADLDQYIIDHEILRIRAKIALFEVCAALDLERYLPLLMAHSLRYLGSRRVQEWLLKQRYLSCGGSNSDSRMARSRLKAIGKSISLDYRAKNALYSSWLIYKVYVRIFKDLENLRKGITKEKGIIQYDRLALDKFCKRNGIGESLKKRVLDKWSQPSSDLSIDILINARIKVSDKAFKHIQSHVSKIMKKHLASATNEALGYKHIIFNSIDHLRAAPNSILVTDIFDIFSKIEISP